MPIGVGCRSTHVGAPLIGIVHELADTRKLQCLVQFGDSLSVVCRAAIPFRFEIDHGLEHSVGPGSVGYCAAGLAVAELTSGETLVILFCVCKQLAALVIDMPQDAGI